MTKDEIALIADLMNELAAVRARHVSWREMLDAAEAIRQLQAENEALRNDAERYRWLRKIDSHAEWNRVGHYAADALDNIIDARK
jgi:hypothetical protein